MALVYNLALLFSFVFLFFLKKKREREGKTKNLAALGFIWPTCGYKRVFTAIEVS
jgi:hypothetical protein